MIVCPQCKSQTSVKETRSFGNYYRRRRICDSIECGHRITTIEIVVADGFRNADDVVLAPRSKLEAFMTLVGETLGR